MRARTAAGLLRMSWPTTVAVPEVGGSSVVSMRRLVDLPAPFGPRKATSSPRCTCRSRSFTASTTVFLTVNVLVRPSAVRIGVLVMPATVRRNQDCCCPRFPPE
jgi:hypothetical protein